MPTEILMPALSPTMEEGVLVRWTKKEGDKVSPGDLVAEVETDKANMDFNIEDEGVLLKLLVKEDSIPGGADHVGGDDRTFGQTWVESRDRARPRGQVALTVMAGGTSRPDLVALTPDQLLARVQPDLAAAIGVLAFTALVRRRERRR